MNSPFEYQESLNSLHFTEEQKAAIARRAAEAARKQTRPARRPVRRMALIAAAAVLVLAVGTAGATGILRSAVEVFSPLFGGAPAQTEIIDKIGYPVGASDTDNGVTITADAVMGDAYNAVIVYTISRDDGTRLLPEDITDEMLLVHGNGTDLSILGGSHGSSYFVVEDPAASSIQMVETVSADKPINDCTATGVFENIYKWDEETGESVPVIEGKWKVKFEMAYEDSSVTLGNGETFTQGGMTFTIPRGLQGGLHRGQRGGLERQRQRPAERGGLPPDGAVLRECGDPADPHRRHGGGPLQRRRQHRPGGRRHRLLQGRDALPGHPHGGHGLHLRGRRGVRSDSGVS